MFVPAVTLFVLNAPAEQTEILGRLNLRKNHLRIYAHAEKKTLLLYNFWFTECCSHTSVRQSKEVTAALVIDGNSVLVLLAVVSRSFFWSFRVDMSIETYLSPCTSFITLDRM